MKFKIPLEKMHVFHIINIIQDINLKCLLYCKCISTFQECCEVVSKTGIANNVVSKEEQ